MKASGASSTVPVTKPRVGSLLRGLTRTVGVRGLPRLLYMSRGLLLGREPRFFRLRDDHALLLDPRDYVECMMFYGRYCTEILDVLQAFVRPGDHVADIGGHVGYFTTHLARLVTSSGRVFTFEPDPRARERLQASVEQNGMEWVSVLPIALSAASGTVEFYLSPQLGWSTGVKNSHLTGLQPTTVPTARLDDLVAEGRVSDRLRLIKMDVEGFEIEALKGMSTVLATARPVLVSEVNPLLLRAVGASPAALVGQVQAYGYEVFGLAERGHWWWRSTGAPAGKAPPSGMLRPLPADVDSFTGDIVCIPEEKVPDWLRGS